MQKIDEAKVKRITKKVDGIPARTQRAHCRYSEIRPLIATNINSIVDGIFNLSLENGKEYPLNRQIDVTLQNIHIYFYTDVPNFEDTGIVPDDFDKSKIVTNPDDGRPEYLWETVNISLQITIDYSLQKNKGLEIKDDNLKITQVPYDGIVSICVNPFFTLRENTISAVVGDCVAGINFASGKQNDYSYHFRNTVIEGWVEVLNDLVHEAYRKYLSRHTKRKLPN